MSSTYYNVQKTYKNIINRQNDYYYIIWMCINTFNKYVDIFIYRLDLCIYI